MITPAWYILKVILCSGILFGYYYAALRNKIFHRWNRFYLLASVVLSVVIPLIQIHIFQNTADSKGPIVRMLQTINSGDKIIVEYNTNGQHHVSADNMIATAYIIVCLSFLVMFLVALRRISGLRKQYPQSKVNEISIFYTDAKGTPFSFLNSIFWNNAINLHSSQGNQIFRHEIAHVKEKHTHDKIFMNIILAFFWINPFFWLIRKELGMTHEFIADKEALDDNDTHSFVEMILQTVYPGHCFSITSNFFNSPLKRRLLMFTKNKNPKVTYLGRLLVLPLAAAVFLAFTLKMKTISSSSFYSGKKITVIIDAGHGGSDNGAVENNIKEKNLTLLIAKEVKQLNKNNNLNIILSRETDVTLTPQDRTKFAEEHKADVFVSIHIDAEANKNEHNGVSIFVPGNDNNWVNASKLLGSSLIESFKNNDHLQTDNVLQQSGKAIWVLKSNHYPCVLIETGFLTSAADLAYLLRNENLQTIAANILNGIESYAGQIR